MNTLKFTLKGTVYGKVHYCSHLLFVSVVNIDHNRLGEEWSYLPWRLQSMDK